MLGKKIGYVRVSSTDQNTARQLDGVQLDKVFTDMCSGKDTERPQLAALLDYLREGDTLVVHSMDRLGRNLDDLRRIVRGLTAKDVVVQFVKEGLTFAGDASPMNNLLLSLLGAVAEFERSLIRERQREGIALAKARGVYRKSRAPLLDPAKLALARAFIRDGVPKTRIARELGVSRASLYVYLNQSTP
jgi:DNA invertase Pin-like site-specific DNA recombinase